MSLLVAWVSLEKKNKQNICTSAYIATESRVSWEYNNHIDYYDSCRKTFYSKLYPDIAGYCGDVLFPSLVLQNIFNLMDIGMLYTREMNCDQRFKIFKNYIEQEINKYPKQQINNSLFEIVYICHEIENPTLYNCYFLKWENQKFTVEKKDIPEQSDKVIVLGSGQSIYNEICKKYILKYGSVSRNFFHSLCFFLDEAPENCGGAPQLIGIYSKPKEGARAYGIIYKNKKYFNGLELTNPVINDDIEWRNECFEICNGETGKRKENAEKQPLLLK